MNLQKAKVKKQKKREFFGFDISIRYRSPTTAGKLNAMMCCQFE
jgi:hypothetical protein